ncbi:hypothetical protein EAF00_007715 [Botryotinia globosa]|nr:hypothetical protein EAF00_007715 [Botryotinia globosa]
MGEFEDQSTVAKQSRVKPAASLCVTVHNAPVLLIDGIIHSSGCLLYLTQLPRKWPFNWRTYFPTTSSIDGVVVESRRNERVISPHQAYTCMPNWQLRESGAEVIHLRNRVSHEVAIEVKMERSENMEGQFDKKREHQLAKVMETNCNSCRRAIYLKVVIITSITPGLW